MLDIALLGTGGFMPMPERYLTTMAAKLNGRMLLIDCGEGTQVTLRMLGWGIKNIDVICLTHFHADHTAGLPGLLLTIGNSGRTEPLTIVGPRKTADLVRCLCVIAPLPYELRFIELPTNQGKVVFDAAGFGLSALPVDHWMDCFGYCIHVSRPGRFDTVKAEGLGVPKKLWRILQNGENVEIDGRPITPDMVLGLPRKGLKVAYITDSRPAISIPTFINDADLFICEGIYGDDELLGKAIEHRHMLFSEAATLARDGLVKKLWLTHFSPALTEPERYLTSATAIFSNTVVGKDRMTARLVFEE